MGLPGLGASDFSPRHLQDLDISPSAAVVAIQQIEGRALLAHCIHLGYIPSAACSVVCAMSAYGKDLEYYC